VRTTRLTRRLSSSGCWTSKLNSNRKMRRKKIEIVHNPEFTSLKLSFKRQNHSWKHKKYELSVCVRNNRKGLNKNKQHPIRAGGMRSSRQELKLYEFAPVRLKHLKVLEVLFNQSKNSSKGRSVLLPYRCLILQTCTRGLSRTKCNHQRPNLSLLLCWWIPRSQFRT